MRSVYFTCEDLLPPVGLTHTGMSLSGDAHHVAVSTEQGGDVTGRGVSGAGLVVCRIGVNSPGSVRQHAPSRGPGHDGCVAVTIQIDLEFSVWARAYTE